MPRPPRRVGREKSFLSTSLTALLPVKAGKSLCRMVSSKGSNRSPIPGTVLARWVHFPIRPCVKAAKAAWGWLAAIVASFSICLVQSVTFEVTYHSVKDLEPRAAPRCLVPCRVIWMPHVGIDQWQRACVPPLQSTTT